MSANLLPVKTGNEQFPVSYRGIFTTSWSPRVSILCENSRELYLFSQIYHNPYDEATYPGTSALYKINMFTGALTKICDFNWSYLNSDRYDSISVGGMLIDDNYIYLSKNNYPSITVLKKNKSSSASVSDPLEKISYTSYTAYSLSGSYGKIEWFNDKIVMLTTYGFVFFNPTTRLFDMHYNSTNYGYYDFAVGNGYCVATRSSSSSPNVIIFDYENNTYTTGTLTQTTASVIAYEDGMFYIAGASKLYVCSISAGVLTTLKTFNTAWTGTPRTLNVVNGVAFVTIQNSSRLYVYDTNAPVGQASNSLILPWTIPSDMSGYQIRPTTFAGYYFLLQNTLGIMDYSGISKYNFGPKYEYLTLMTNKSKEHTFNFDPRFVEFEDTFMTVRDGDIAKPLLLNDNVNHIKTAVFNKSEYKYLNQIAFSSSNNT